MRGLFGRRIGERRSVVAAHITCLGTHLEQLLILCLIEVGPPPMAVRTHIGTSCSGKDWILIVSVIGAIGRNG